ncbi:hypothetical protein FRC09_000825 [Ceratobasidium sp. 395]|nr:hypothetical protein FRC09_000825 [Ceratobasidium sp. 395]
MPVSRRQRRPEPVVTCSPTKSNDAGAGLADSSGTLAGSTEPAVVVSDHKVVPGCDSPARQGTTIDECSPVTNPSENCSVLTAQCIPSDVATPSRVGTPKPDDAPEPGDLEEVESSEINYLDPPDNLFKVKTEPDAPQVPKPGTLFAATHKSQQAAASARAGGDPHVWLTTPMAKTGTPALDHALDDLRSSRYCLWMGDSHRILKNCAWVEGEQPYTATLQWKPDSSSKIAHDEGDAILCFLGAVSSTGCTVGPAGGWQPLYGEKKLDKQKRNFRTVNPGPASNIQPIYWDTQVQGATRLIEDGCKPSKPGSYLKAVVQDDQEDREDDTDAVSSHGEETSDSCEFPSWSIGSDTREAFERVIEQGHEPQVLEAFDRNDRLIHPNNVVSTLTGAIVVVYCTLERSRFPKNIKRPKPEYQFYANLVKVQVVKNAPPPKPTAGIKRKFVRSYGATDRFGLDSSDEAAPVKKGKFTE